MIKKLGLMALSALLLQPIHSFANDCGLLEITIYNNTSQSCELSSWSVDGTLLSFPDHIIKPGYHGTSFVMAQNHVGPSVHLHYKCGGRDIGLYSKQNYCLLAAGDITAKITLREPHSIIAYPKAHAGSFSESARGKLEWAISDF